MASSSFAGANHQPVPNSSSGRARRLSPFPPAPKSVRVVSVFSEAQPSVTPDSPASPKPETHQAGSWPRVRCPLLCPRLRGDHSLVGRLRANFRRV